MLFSRRRIPVALTLFLLCAITSLVALGSMQSALAQSTVIATEDFDGGAVNLTSTANVFDYNAGGGAGGDVFGRVDGQAGGTGMPFDVADDTVADVSGARAGAPFLTDPSGIAGQNTTAFFALNDMDGSGVNGNTSATWTFDISSATSIANIQIDQAAMGDFEANSSDGYLIEARIDANPFQTIFAAITDEDASHTYRPLDDGNAVILNDPLELFIDGDATPVGLLDKSDPATGAFDTYTSVLLAGQSGSTLDIRISWTGAPSGSEPMGIDNITINGEIGSISSGQPLPLSEDFDDCTLAGWEIVSVDADATNTWSCNATFSNIEANGFGDSAPANEWLITPPLNLDAQDNEQLSFRSHTSFTDSGIPYPQLSVKYSTDYDGSGDPTSATWTDLTGITFSPEDSGTWTDSGPIDLAGLSGNNVYFAFQYRSSGTGSGTASRWRLDTISFAVSTTTAPDILINEIDADTPGADTAEFIELYDGGVGNTALDGLTLVFFNGSGDTSYAALDLDGFSTDAEGYFVIGNPGVANVGLVIDPGSGGFVQNGADAVALYSADASAFPNGTAVTTDQLIDAVVYDTNDSDDAGLLVLLNTGQPQVNEDGQGDKDNDSNQRCPNGTGGLRNTDSFDQYAPTPGEANVCTTTITATPAKIHEIQGSGDTVTGAGPFIVEAIVVGNYTGSGQLNGFFIQEEDADVDGDPATSEGIFVFCGSCTTPVAIGDLVQVTGAASDFFDMSQLTATTAGDVVVVSNSNTLPTPSSVALPIPGFTATDPTTAEMQINAYFEPFEGMLVQFPQTLTVVEYFELSRYGQILLASERLRQFTDQNVPSAAGFAQHQAMVASSSIILDDDNNIQNAALEDDGTVDDDPVFYPATGGFSTGNSFRGGDTITTLTGVLHWSFAGQSGTDAWRIRPVTEQFSYNFTSVNPRTAAPDSVSTVQASGTQGRAASNVTVASFNVLNYFTTIDTTASNNTGDCGIPSGDQDCRGADSEAERIRQLDKIVEALNAMDADIVGLIELENTTAADPAGDGNDPVLQSIVDALNAVNAGTYDFIDTGVIGTDAIRVAFIYKTDTVAPTGNFAILDSSVDPNFVDTLNRPALAQTFTELASGGSLTVVVNHLKSKGSGCGGGDDDTTTGQGNCNGTRTAAASALATWLATDPTGSGDQDILVIGDLNAYRNEDPIVALENGGFTDLLDLLIGPDAYGYLFDGQLGYLDHALVNASLLSQVTGVTVWHTNADEVNLLDYNDMVRDQGEASFEEKPEPNELYEANAFRSSDHDPVLVGLNLTPPTGNIVLEKAVVNDNTGTLTPDNFPLHLDGSTVTRSTVNSVAVGTHTIAETQQSGYTLESLLCVDGSSNTVSTTANGSGGYTLTAMADQTVTCTFTNNDNVPPAPAGVILEESGGISDVKEGDGSIAGYWLSLTRKPTANVTIRIYPDSQLKTNKSAVTFTPSNWHLKQLVHMYAVDDGIVEGDHLGFVTHTVHSNDLAYDGNVPFIGNGPTKDTEPSKIQVYITDNDQAGIDIAESAGISDVKEGSTYPAGYYMTLKSQPTAPVTVHINTDAQVTTDKSRLTFDANNWSVGQLVLIRSVDDHVVEGDHTSIVRHTVQSADPNYNGNVPFTGNGPTANTDPSTVLVYITDNDQARATVNVSNLSLLEVDDGAAVAVARAVAAPAGANEDQYTIILESQPQGTVTIQIQTDGQVSVRPATITFDATNWQMPQAIAVTAVNDDLAEGMHTSLIRHTVASADAAYQALTVADVTVQIADDDQASLRILPGNLIIAEGSNRQYQITLSQAPQAPVTVNIGSSEGATVSPTVLSFNADNWQTPQLVTVAVDNDDVVAGLRSIFLSHTVDSADLLYDGYDLAQVQVVMVEDDVAAMELSATELTVAEGGAGATYQVHLASRPTAPVTVQLQSDAQIMALGPDGRTAVTFDATNWSQPQTVTVQATDDAVREDPLVVEITHLVESDDAIYQTLDLSAVQVTVQDNDVAGLSLSTTALALQEGAAGGSYSIQLTSEPKAPVRVLLLTNDQVRTDVEVLTFDSTNWQTGQTVTVTAVDDAALEGLHQDSVQHLASGEDADYDGEILATVSIEITDNDSLTDDGDGDGSSNGDEDPDGDGDPNGDDSDADGTPDYLDPDDSGNGDPIGTGESFHLFLPFISGR